MPEPKEKPEERKKKKSGKRFNKRRISEILSDRLHGASFDHDESTRNCAARVRSSFVQDKNNPKSWYIRYTDITPARNMNRPMEPIFNTTVNPNGTLGVPKFIELDVEWRGFANTFMMDQIAYSAMQQIRKALKSNLFYNDDVVKACLTNGIALATAAKILERDVHWNLYNGSSDFNFSKMYKYQNQVIGTFGRVALYPKDYLLDENLPYTSTIYNKVVSLSNQVLKLPKRIAEFVSHYFGSLFTLDTDGFNDQYLKINMHEMDYYQDGDPSQFGTIDVAAIGLDALLEELNQYSKKFAVILADLEKCLGVSSVTLQRYEDYTYAFIYDKTLLQALINGYTDDSVVIHNFIRMDQLDDVADDLTQFLFLGGVQPADSSKANVKAIKILDMVVKVNSDSNIKWPSLLEQLGLSDSVGDFTTYDEPIGLSITTNYVIDDTIISSVESSATDVAMAVPQYPAEIAQLDSFNAISHNVGISAGTQFPASPYTRIATVEDRAQALIGMIYLGGIWLRDKVTNAKSFILYFATTPAFTIGQISVDYTWKSAAYDKVYYVRYDNADIQNARSYERSVTAKTDPSFWFFRVDPADVSNSILNHLIQNTDLDTPDFTGFGTVTSFPIGLMLSMRYRFHGSSNGYVTDQYIHGPLVDQQLAWVESASDTGDAVSLLNTFTPAPVGVFGIRSVTISATVSQITASQSVVAGGEALLLYVTQVVDYHLPVNYKRIIHARIESQDLAAPIVVKNESLPTLVKEDYKPYLYNVMDLIPVLYEMFVSLFSIDNISRNKR